LNWKYCIGSWDRVQIFNFSSIWQHLGKLFVVFLFEVF
jgi:hypothetical protein